MYKLYKDSKRELVCLVGIRLHDIAFWQMNNSLQQNKLTYDWDQIEKIDYDKKSFSVILKRQTSDAKIKYATDNSKK